jgi:hypothetical protein
VLQCAGGDVPAIAKHLLENDGAISKYIAPQNSAAMLYFLSTRSITDIKRGLKALKLENTVIINIIWQNSIAHTI